MTDQWKSAQSRRFIYFEEIKAGLPSFTDPKSIGSKLGGLHMSNETARLRLREWQQSDFETYARFYADENQSRFVGGPMSRVTAWRQLATVVGHWQLKGFGLWAVEDKRTSQLLGSTGLWQPEGWPKLELGYWLLEEAQGHGFAVEAAVYARDYAFNVLQSPSLVSYIDPTNTASIAVAKRAGAAYLETIDLLEEGQHDVYRYVDSNCSGVPADATSLP